MTDIETQANNLASSIVDHVNVIVLNSYLHGVFDCPMDESGLDMFGDFENTEAVRESLRHFITDCIGTDWWCVSDTWFEVSHTYSTGRTHMEKIKIPIIRPINAQVITIDKAIKIEI